MRFPFVYDPQVYESAKYRYNVSLGIIFPVQLEFDIPHLPTAHNRQIRY